MTYISNENLITQALEKICNQTSKGLNVIITGGIGDVLAIESFLSNELRDNIETIFYANGNPKIVKELFEVVNYPKLKNHIPLWGDVKAQAKFKIQEKLLSQVPNVILNLSTQALFPKILKGEVKYNSSSFLNQELCDINHFNLPTKFVCIAGHSNNLDHAKELRNFNQTEWGNICHMLKIRKLYAVNISLGNNQVPNHPNIINLDSKTTILESIEILKKAKGFIGIDSYLAILASKLSLPMFCIKTLSPWTIKNKDVYYAPNTSFNFLTNSVRFENTKFL